MNMVMNMVLPHYIIIALIFESSNLQKIKSFTTYLLVAHVSVPKRRF